MRLIKRLALSLTILALAACPALAQKISQFPSGSALTGAELLLGDQSSNTVTFTANQIKTFVGSGLTAIPNNTLLSNIAGSTAIPIGNSLSAIFDSSLCNQQGDVLFRNASQWVCLPVGTAGQVLATGGAGGNPSWVSTGGTGTVTNVNTGTGLTGGPITGAGTISLASISNNQILANTSGGVAAPFGTSLSSIIDSAVGSTQGEILFRNASQWTVLNPGTSGQFLQTQGAASNPVWASAAGGGTVTSVATGACLTGGTITSSGTIAGLNPVNAQVGTTYSVVNGDQCKLVTFSNTNPVAVSIPQAGGGGNFATGWLAFFQNRNTGTVTITPTTSTIDGAATIQLTQNQGMAIFSDGANYFTFRGVGAAGVVSVSAGLGLTTTPGSTGGSITTSGTVSETFPPNVKTGAYSIVNGDQHSLLVFNSSVGATFSLPQAGGSGNFLKGWSVCFESISTGLLTITATTSTIDGASSVTLGQNTGMCLASDGSNYFTQRGIGSGGAVSITAGNAGVIVSPSPLTGVGTISTSFPSQTKIANYTLIATDLSKFTWFNSASAVTAVVPQATGTFANGAALCIGDQGAGALTLSPTTSTIYGIPSLVLSQNQSVCLISDGTNWGAQLSPNLIKLVDTGSLISSSENMDLTSLALLTEIANAGTTGTTVNKLAKLTGAPSTALIAAITDTNGAIGVVIGGAGTTANAQIATAGQAACVFDGATTAGDYVQISASVAGDCHDAGSTFPTSGQVIGRVLSTNGATGTFAMVVFPPPGQGTGGGGGGSGTVTNIAMGAGIASTITGGTTAITTTGTVFADASYFQFYLGGLTLSNDGTTPNTIIDIAAGSAASDDNTVMMKLASFTKTTGAWALGTSNGCLDTGTVANATWYHVFLIERTDTGVVDVLCSTNASAPTFPTSYTKKRRVGSFKTNGAAAILAFKQVGNVYYWATATLDVTVATLSTTATSFPLNVPPGVKVQPICRYSFSNAAATTLLLTSPDETDVAPSTANPFTTAPGWDADQPSTTAVGGNGACPFLTTDTSQNIRARASNATTSLDVVTRGWVD